MKNFIISMSIICVALSAASQEPGNLVHDGIKYKWNERTYDVTVDQIISSPATTSKLIIPPCIEVSMSHPLGGIEGTFTVSGIEPKAFSNINVDSIYLPPTIRELTPGALADCNARYISLPSRLMTIQQNAVTGLQHLDSLIIPEGVKIISPNAIIMSEQTGGSMCTYLELPSTLTYIGNWGLSGFKNLKKLRIRATTPPEATEESFGHAFYQALPIDGDVLMAIRGDLEVPQGSLDAYRNHPGWGAAFDNITEYSTAGIDTPVATPGNAGFQATSSRGCITVKTTAATNMTITTADGITVFSERVDGNRSLRMPSGVYIVSAPGRSVKLAVQ